MVDGENMLMPCEAIIKKFLPAIRAASAKKLFREYGQSQTKIAKALGITQASVSNYMSGNYASSIKAMEKLPEVKRVAGKIARLVAGNKAGKNEVLKNICFACSGFMGNPCRENRFFKKLSKKL